MNYIVIGIMLIGCLIGVSPHVEGYTGIDVDVLIDYMDDSSDDSDEAIINQFQTYFIKTMYLTPIFTNKQRFYQDEEESSQILNDVSNEILMNQLAKQLADQDALKLKDILLEGIQTER